MQQIFLGLIVFLVVFLSGIALFYVWINFLYNVNNDIPNPSTKANIGPIVPRYPNIPTQTVQSTTTPIQPDELECWSQYGLSGGKTSKCFFKLS